eukprot:762016-Pleurochrysis_carterae.AAC.2
MFKLYYSRGKRRRSSASGRTRATRGCQSAGWLAALSDFYTTAQPYARRSFEISSVKISLPLWLPLNTPRGSMWTLSVLRHVLTRPALS